MCFKISKKVAVLDDTLEGTVVGINNQIIDVMDTDGMIYQFNKNELITLERKQNQLSEYETVNHSFLREKLDERKNESSIFNKHRKKLILEVDLHIDQLMKNTKKISNVRIISLQLEVAKKKIEFALAKQISKIIFIHGVGAGVLKSELHSLLKSHALKFYEAPYKKYGQGATEVDLY